MTALPSATGISRPSDNSLLTSKKRAVVLKQAVEPASKSLSRLVSGKKMKNDTIVTYQEQFGPPHPASITTTALGTSKFHPVQPLSQYNLVRLLEYCQKRKDVTMIMA